MQWSVLSFSPSFSGTNSSGFRWAAECAYTQGYLVPTAARLYHEAGLTMLFGSTGWDSGDDLRNEHEATIRSGFRLVEFGLWNSYPKGYEEDRCGLRGDARQEVSRTQAVALGP
jgi:hypothetical protein